MNIWMILLFLMAGFVLGYLKILPRKIMGITDYITYVGLIILLAAMGAKIGLDDKVLSKLDYMGLQALILASASIIGSLLLVKLFSVFLKANLDSSSEELTEEKENNGHIVTFTIIFSVVAGIAVGFYFLPRSFLGYIDIITTYALALLLFGIGIDIGGSQHVLSQLKVFGWQIFLIPLLIGIGSIGGTVLCSLFLNLAFNEAAAVGAGFGWYSLSGVLLTNIYSLELGSLAFLTNVFRELLTIISLPLVVKYLGPWASIAPGGATTMDVTLPVIKETAGKEIVIPAFVSGAVLSLLVPILVPLLIKL